MRVEKQVEVARPRAHLFGIMSDLRRLPEWSALCDEVVVVEGTAGQGLRFEQRLSTGESHPVRTFEVVELTAPERIVYRTVDGPEVVVSHTLEDRGGATRVWFEVAQEEPGGGADDYDRVSWEKQHERKVELSLQDLKRIAESEPPGP